MRRRFAILLLMMICVTLACDPNQFPNTRHAATQATQAVTETMSKASEEVRPMARQVAQESRAALQHGREVATRKMEELQPKIDAAKASATRMAHELKE